MEKLIIIGAGVAGWTAAIYAGRASLEPLMFTGIEEGGQLMLTTDVENFPGFPEGIIGSDLVEKLKKQAERFGTRIFQKNVTGFKKIKGGYEIAVGKEKYSSKTIIISTGASARWLGLPNEKNFQGRGLHTCATCDGFFYKDKEIFVVGGGDSAMEEANFLTKFAKKVTIVHRKDTFRASKIMQEKVRKNPKIEIMLDSEITGLKGEPPLKMVTIKNAKTGKTKNYKIDGIFLAIGHIPNTAIFQGLVELDEHGFIKTDRRMRTNLPGVFAAGDVQDPIYKQAVTAAGTGCQAAMEAERYYDEVKEK
ncbi:thioredoxin-disulfide reductase [Candidatus Pacearchaeota archaeon]|nr:hypothetical protein [uncultured archaeon]MBS3084450.1 thioredoxin-disulfide reductase [Candidatus Pacearchaeota archaeon]